MAERIKIGLIYSYNNDWVAGAYYILNLIHALNILEDEDKPELTILCHSKEEFDFVKKTNYPYLHFKQLYEKDFWVSYNLFERGINKFSKLISGKHLSNKKQTNKRLKIRLDLLFPASDHIYFSSVKNRLYWIPDFQEHFLPQFFSDQEIAQRKKYQKKFSDNAFPIIFSSNNALKHFKSIYPDSKSKTFILQFAVTHPSYKNIDLKELLKKYNINRPYFFCPNQVWAHKNHITVLKALKLLKDQNEKEVLIVFSGKESDHRNPDFFSGLKKYINENHIGNSVRFLGFIERSDQLQLMNNAISVIQPSLFEGWSTVIEDAKAMNQYIVASDLEVHREQLSENAVFFDPLDEYQLALIIKEFQYKNPTKKNILYKQDIHRFATQFIEIVTQILPQPKH